MALHDDFADMNSQSTEVPTQELADSDQWGLFGPSRKIKSRFGELFCEHLRVARRVLRAVF